MAENASFDALIDKIGPAFFAVGDDKKTGRGRKGKVQKVTRRYISAMGDRHPWVDSYKKLACLVHLVT